MSRRGPLLGPLALATMACGGQTSLPVDARCNPLGAGACLAPWPSSAFEADDPSTATGRRLAIPEDAIPRGATDEPVDPALWNALDGFSPQTPIIVEFPGGVSDVGLPAADNMDPSLAADSPTVILDLTTGARVAHHAELGDDDSLLVLHPAARLAYGHRYAVAITSRVVAADGGDLPISPGFRALVADRHTDHPLLEAMRPRLDEVLDALDEAGVVDDLVVAWDFTVASESSLHAEVTAARDRGRATLATHPSLYAIHTDTRAGRLRLVTGTLDAPLVLSNGGEPRANTRVVHDDAGLPAIQGLYRIGFSAVIPTCAAPMPIVLWGHAPFGDASEVLGEGGRRLASELCAVVVGIDQRGRTAADAPAVERAIADLGNAAELDTVVQGIVDHATLMRALETVLANALSTGGKRRLVDPSRIYYVGHDPAIAALPGLTRAVLVDPGDRQPDRSALAHRYAPADALLVRALIDARWERVQPARFEHAVLIQAGAGEPTSWLARTFALPMIDPASTPWGVKTLRAPQPGSGVVLDRSVQTLREFLALGRIAPTPM